MGSLRPYAQASPLSLRGGFYEFPGSPEFGHRRGKFECDVHAARQASAEKFDHAFLGVLVLLIGYEDFLARLHRRIHRNQPAARVGRDGVGVLVERLAIGPATVDEQRELDLVDPGGRLAACLSGPRMGGKVVAVASRRSAPSASPAVAGPLRRVGLGRRVHFIQAEIARDFLDDFRRDGVLPLPERPHEGLFAEQVGHARNAARVPEHRFNRRGAEDFVPVAAGNAQPFENVAGCFFERQRKRLGPERDALPQLPEFSLVQFLLNLRLARQHDLEQFVS